jgi:hypothetical protein
MRGIKIIISCGIIFIISCTKIQPTPTPSIPVSKDIFAVSQSSVTNGMDIVVNLKTSGVYTLTMGDSTTNQVITRERFNGKVGENKLKIYTNTLSTKYLYLLLEDQYKTKVVRTSITVN